MQKRCIRHGPGTALARASAQNHSLLRRKPQSVTHRKLACAQAAVAPEEISHAQLVNNLFEDLCSHCQIKTHVKVGDSSTGGIGLFATQPCAKGDTIIRVPRSLCIVIDNETGSLSIPQGQWPRLSGGIVQEGEPLTCEYTLHSCCCCCRSLSTLILYTDVRNCKQPWHGTSCAETFGLYVCWQVHTLL